MSYYNRKDLIEDAIHSKCGELGIDYEGATIFIYDRIGTDCNDFRAVDIAKEILEVGGLYCYTTSETFLYAVRALMTEEEADYGTVLICQYNDEEEEVAVSEIDETGMFRQRLPRWFSSIHIDLGIKILKAQRKHVKLSRGES